MWYVIKTVLYFVTFFRSSRLHIVVCDSYVMIMRVYTISKWLCFYRTFSASANSTRFILRLSNSVLNMQRSSVLLNTVVWLHEIRGILRNADGKRRNRVRFKMSLRAVAVEQHYKQAKWACKRYFFSSPRWIELLSRTSYEASKDCFQFILLTLRRE